MPIDWLDPWYAVDDAQRKGLERELHREIGPHHILHGLPVSIIGLRKDCDDVLLYLLDGTDRFSVAHLTWRGAADPDPAWPHTKIYADQRAWEEWGLNRDHEDWWGDRSVEDIFDDIEG